MKVCWFWLRVCLMKCFLICVGWWLWLLMMILLISVLVMWWSYVVFFVMWWMCWKLLVLLCFLLLIVCCWWLLFFWVVFFWCWCVCCVRNWNCCCCSIWGRLCVMLDNFVFEWKSSLLWWVSVVVFGKNFLLMIGWCSCWWMLMRKWLMW